MRMECDNCGKIFQDTSEFKHVFPDIPDLLSRIDAGDTVPCAECPDCGALVYETDVNDSDEEDVESKSPVCPVCGSQRIAEIDVLPGYALIESVNADGTIDWAGDTEIDWNNQRPESDPPEFICLGCAKTFGWNELWTPVKNVRKRKKV